jgi:hypothetical protein
MEGMKKNVEVIKSIFGNRDKIRFSELQINKEENFKAFQYMEKECMVSTYFEGDKIYVKRETF